LDPDALDALRPLFIAWSALVGAVVGSFLNVVIARVPAGLSVVHPRSRCPRCLAPIAWYDNLPVLSWLLLRARCRRCALPISIRYPLVELLVAVLAGLAAWRHGLEGPGPAGALVELTFAGLLVALAFIDLDTWLLPWALTLPLAALGLVAGALQLTPAGSLGAAALGGALGFAAFLVVHLLGEKVFHREAMGFGDVVLLGGLGAYLGPSGLLPVILLSSLQGAVIGIVLLLLGRGEQGSGAEAAGDAAGAPASAGPNAGATAPSEEDDWVPPRHAIPYGPFLALAALEWLLLAPWLARAVPMLSVFVRR
jgi:leader peptidase (prepilin peptidase) / N-methyltransferase